MVMVVNSMLNVWRLTGEYRGPLKLPQIFADDSFILGEDETSVSRPPDRESSPRLSFRVVPSRHDRGG
jgi:hypothetical protein